MVYYWGIERVIRYKNGSGALFKKGATKPICFYSKDCTVEILDLSLSITQVKDANPWHIASIGLCDCSHPKSNHPYGKRDKQ